MMTAYVEHIPREYRSDARLLEYFQTIFSKERVLDAKIAVGIENLEKKLPHLSISQKELEMTALKVSVAENSNPRNGIWEIKIKPVELLKHRSDQMTKKDL